MRTNWMALLPIDGSLLVAGIVDPPTTGPNYSGGYLLMAADGLPSAKTPTAAGTDNSAWALVPPIAPAPGVGFYPNLAAAQGGPASNATTVNATNLYVNPTEDPFLTLDPNASGPGVPAGVNQMLGFMTDNVGTVLPLITQLTYSPRYLFPR